MVARGLTPSRTQAQALIRAGRILVDGRVVDKPGTPVPPTAELKVVEPPRYVSRGGEKLEAALRAFAVSPVGKVCLDVGASTGGFTDCLLQHGAAKVYALDVGRGQLDWKLREDSRVVVLEGRNARFLTPQALGELVDLVTVDVSFISLRLVLPPLEGIVQPQGDVVALVKPQFEAGRDKVRKGVVSDPRVHREVLEGLVDFVLTELGWSVLGAVPSPLLGPAGNKEFFVHLGPRPGESVELQWSQLGIGEGSEEKSTGEGHSPQENSTGGQQPPPGRQ